MFLIVSELREQLGHCITVAQSLNTRCQSMLKKSPLTPVFQRG